LFDKRNERTLRANVQAEMRVDDVVDPERGVSTAQPSHLGEDHDLAACHIALALRTSARGRKIEADGRRW
jgi:hypothetical protein